MTKISFDARTKQEAKSLTDTQADTVFDRADKTREKTNKFKMLINGRKNFRNDGSQNYLIFQLIPNTFRMSASDTETIIACKSKGLLDEALSLLLHQLIVLLQN